MIKKNKKALALNLIDLIAGIIVIAGGALIAASYVNAGLLLTIIGSLFEAVKIIMQQGLK